MITYGKRWAGTLRLSLAGLAFLAAVVWTALGVHAATADLKTDRTSGTCDYTVSDVAEGASVSMIVKDKDGNEVRKSSLVVEGKKASGSFSLSDLGNVFGVYTVDFVVGEETVNAICLFMRMPPSPA